MLKDKIRKKKNKDLKRKTKQRQKKKLQLIVFCKVMLSKNNISFSILLNFFI
jgi:hypothetical protein